MVRMAISAIAVLFLAGCGSATGESGFDTDDKFKSDCINYGGTYTEYEKGGDTCIYEQGKP